MTNPHDGLLSMQAAIDANAIAFHRGELDNDLFVHVDKPTPNVVRYSYTYIENGIATALSIVVMVEPIDGTPCFQIGYAVPNELRGQGRATRVLKASVAEIRSGLTRHGVGQICIEAIIGTDNLPSIRVFENAFPDAHRKETTDKISGAPAIQLVAFLPP